jgi:trans-aconitate methyltransferase
MYGDLADWWPVISPPAEYADEADLLAGLLRTGTRPVRDVLELGSGGGNNASYLRNDFQMTLVDRSEPMLRVSQRLNPDCEHICADMRTVRLGHDFDAVLVHDAVDYLTEESQLLAVFTTATAHLRPGGVAVFVPDHVSDTYLATTRHGGSDADDGRAARYLEWPLPKPEMQEWFETVYVLVLRDAEGSVQTKTETHRFGLFPRATWVRLLSTAGLMPTAIDLNDDYGRTAFVGHLA